MDTSIEYRPRLEITPDAERLAQKAVDVFYKTAQETIRNNGIFHVAVSGGRTPQRFFELLGASPRAQSLDWEKVHIFWADERYVPPDSEASNYKMAADAFLVNVTIPQENIHRIPTEYNDVCDAVRCYENTIYEVIGTEKEQPPRFDLIMLGMGEDGHTASLFPNSYASFDKDDLACAVYQTGGKLSRITLTHPVLCAASQLVIMVSGQEKARVLKEVLTSEPDEVRYPIHTLWPVLDKVMWLVDSEAARTLSPENKE
jgi:6-phosphogluconolactonase